MKIISLISFVVTTLLSFAQTGEIIRSDVRIHFNGSIDFDSTNVTIANVAIFQDSLLTIVSSDTTGKYRIITSVDIKRPFSLTFSCKECVEKTVLFNLENINLDHPSLAIRPIHPIESLDMEMIPINPASNIESFQIARFYWNNLVRLDNGYSELQKLKIENYSANIDTTRSTYHANGQLSRIVPMKDSLLNGQILYYDEDGVKTLEMNVENDELNGETLTYYSNGSVKSKSIYAEGELVNGQYYYYSNDDELIKTIHL